MFLDENLLHLYFMGRITEHSSLYRAKSYKGFVYLQYKTVLIGTLKIEI